jgi:hypothetical protein
MRDSGYIFSASTMVAFVCLFLALFSLYCRRMRLKYSHLEEDAVSHPPSIPRHRLTTTTTTTHLPVEAPTPLHTVRIPLNYTPSTAGVTGTGSNTGTMLQFTGSAVAMYGILQKEQ